jgi:DNA repair ATPase RecN
MSQDVIRQLTEWSSTHSGERAAFAKTLADEMSSDNKKGALSLIDVRREFEAREEPTGFQYLDVIRALVTAMYLVPIAFTWFELRQVISGFDAYSNSSSGIRNATLISFWAGGYNRAYEGMPLQTVSLVISVFIVVLMALQFSIDFFNSENADISPDLNSLIFATQLELAKTRALTPQEFTETISSAAESLEHALLTITSVVEEASSMIGNISQATDGLTTASVAIQTVSVRLESALAPIVNLESSLSSANSTIQSSTRAMEEMRNSMSSALNSLASVSEQTSLIGKASVAVEAATTRLMGQVTAAGNALGATDDRLRSAVNSASQISDRLADVVSSTETHEPHLATMSRIAQSLSETVYSIQTTVQEVKAATSRFEELNREIAIALRSN